jgi:hypothetical protein
VAAAEELRPGDNHVALLRLASHGAERKLRIFQGGKSAGSETISFEEIGAPEWALCEREV